MLGRAAVAMWWDVAPEMSAEWEDWHTSEHMPERLAIPGFLRGTRWVARSGEPSYFVCTKSRTWPTITAGRYLERLNNPTPWSRKMMPHHRNMVRSLCAVRASWGGGVPQALATIRFSPPPDLPKLPRRQGLTGAHLLESQPMPGDADHRAEDPRRRRDRRLGAARRRLRRGSVKAADARCRAGVIGVLSPGLFAERRRIA